MPDYETKEQDFGYIEIPEDMMNVKVMIGFDQFLQLTPKSPPDFLQMAAKITKVSKHSVSCVLQTPDGSIAYVEYHRRSIRFVAMESPISSLSIS
ncbi:MAG: hypothetical protein QNK24_10330 [Desulfuromusa sp.]|nr:hypothetical protein [Desulfuromusa sp.]